MKGKTVAILESQMRDHIDSLVRKNGGTPFSALALAEIPDVDPAHIDESMTEIRAARDIHFSDGRRDTCPVRYNSVARANRCSVAATSLGAGGRSGRQAGLAASRTCEEITFLLSAEKREKAVSERYSSISLDHGIRIA
jgi:hypothetical protein